MLKRFDLVQAASSNFRSQNLIAYPTSSFQFSKFFFTMAMN